MSSGLFEEAERIVTICNACRYCEGFCAVFPAMERQRAFSREDLLYLANLCHDCRDCFYACQYAPPHPFDLNFPKTMAELRVSGYERYAWPPFARIFFRKGGPVFTTALVSVFLAVFYLFSFVLGVDLFDAHTREASFFAVIPYPFLLAFFSSILGVAVVGIVKSTSRFWKDIGVGRRGWRHLPSHGRALRDSLFLTHLGGSGVGCNYPGDEFSMARRFLHHSVFFGFLLCFAATVAAAYSDHILGLPVPYPATSWPVLLGSLGGTALVTGTSGLIFFKLRMDPAPSPPQSRGHDLVFLFTLFFVALSGLLLLFLRKTPFMGPLMIVHLGLVAGFFASMPWSKFIHGFFRYAALFRNAVDAREKD